MPLAQFEPKKIYIRVEAQPITTSGIYHNSDLGLISLSSDGSNWITIADKNLGATQVYNSGDTLSEANCGKYYQWGNNYGFPFTGSVTNSYSQVDASAYGPGNYYSSSTFISPSSGAYDWSNTQNDNLRGDTTNTNVARMGPCDTGYHVPTTTELLGIYNIWKALGGGASDGNNFGMILKLPKAGRRDYYGASPLGVDSEGFYWTSSPRAKYSYLLRFSQSSISSQTDDYRSYGQSIRPFKNEAVQPDDSRTVLYPSS